MKAKFHRASEYEVYSVETVDTLEDLLSLIDREAERIIVCRNDSYHSKPPYHDKWEAVKWEKDEAQGLHECELELLVYDECLE